VIVRPQELKIGGVPYTLWYSLGSGLYGEVFRASERDGYFWRSDERDPGQLWAIKKLFTTPDLPTREAVREAGAWEFVTALMLAVEYKRPHPNIVSVRMGQEVEGDYYIVMEFCEGSLANLFAYGLYGEAWILPVASDLLAALQFIHDLGALHNDLHSRNLLFARDLRTRRPSWREKQAFFPLLGPGLFTFKLADFGQASSWFRRAAGDEHPELIVGDIRMAAYVLADVALGRHEAELQPDALRRAAGRYAAPIQEALNNDFGGEGAALAFLAALMNA